MPTASAYRSCITIVSGRVESRHSLRVGRRAAVTVAHTAAASHRSCSSGGGGRGGVCDTDLSRIAEHPRSTPSEIRCRRVARFFRRARISTGTWRSLRNDGSAGWPFRNRVRDGENRKRRREIEREERSSMAAGVIGDEGEERPPSYFNGC